MSSIEVFNKENFPIPENLLFNFQKIFEYIKQKFNLPAYKLEVAFLTESEIFKLNKKYRNKNSSTDVLSFCFLGEENNSFLGVIYFCYPVVKKNNPDIFYEFCFLFVHSCLHLLGFDHGPEMFNIEHSIIKNFFCYI